ncbi:hypothetical protein X777_01731 [Ooceraea biroi]|uniref:Uncharacterized protein n=1 Tax=Ooceraea biroi TaxID=2015173 RepID=A0A026WM89_OOCBI|nr:hypothetical protein X777_01731 [Ooceraea biroi]
MRLQLMEDGAIDGGESTKQSDVEAYQRPAKNVVAQTGGNALLPCRFNGPGISKVDIIKHIYFYGMVSTSYVSYQCAFEMSGNFEQ